MHQVRDLLLLLLNMHIMKKMSDFDINGMLLLCTNVLLTP